MRFYLLALSTSILTFYCAAAGYAQTEQQEYANVVCVKTKPGKGAEWEQFVRDTYRRLLTARANHGDYARLVLTRNVYPSGESAECDYYLIHQYSGLRGLLDFDLFTERWRRAGMQITLAEYSARQNNLRTTVKQELWQSAALVGTVRPGDWMRIRYRKISTDMTEHRRSFREFNRPVREAQVREKTLRAWHAYTLSLPSGTSQPYNSAGISIYPSFAAAQQDPAGGSSFVGTFRQLFGKTPAEAGLPAGTVQTQIARVVDVIPVGAAGPALSENQARPSRKKGGNNR